VLAAKMLKLALSTDRYFWASAASVEPAAKGEMGLHGREHEHESGDDLRV